MRGGGEKVEEWKSGQVEETVNCGIINAVGGIKDAMNKLYEMINLRKNCIHDDNCKEK